MPVPSFHDCAHAIRFLSMDAVQKAKSGHPGMPMGMADIATALWQNHLAHNPKNPNWLNRDRFILSNGHGSMLQYALLHLSGYEVSIHDLQQFRQLHSKTPGHPEVGVTPGVETTTGPLGQGLGNAVGMALAEQVLGAQFNKPEHNIVDHYTYAFAGDGCLMEGVSHEVCSLAGTLGLGKLIVFWDDNGISIDGQVRGWFTDDTPKRFESYGWQVIDQVDGHQPEQLNEAILEAKANTTQPTLICCRTTIGYGSPSLAGTAKTHGAPLGDDEIAATREALGWTHAPFEVPEDVRAAWDATEKGAALEAVWQEKWDAYAAAYPALAADYTRRLSGQLPEDWPTWIQAQIDTWLENHADAKIATRKASQETLKVLGPHLPAFIGGSADLTDSNLTAWTKDNVITPGAFDGQYVFYGVREFGMNAIMNGLALHGGFIPYGGTFLTFFDYGKNAVRLSALMKQRVIYVYTHDSIGVGEDGPTHQPIEHVSNLRAMPNVETWRPADAVETFAAWHQAVERDDGPSVLCLTRQGVPGLGYDKAAYNDACQGAVVRSGDENSALVIIATGSEVALAEAVAARLPQSVRVISMPCMERFRQLSKAKRAEILPPHIKKRVAIEAGASQSWYEWVGTSGLVVGIDTFGESAPGADCFEHFGLTPDAVIEKIQAWLAEGE